jgi:hypothetical protein
MITSRLCAAHSIADHVPGSGRARNWGPGGGEQAPPPVAQRPQGDQQLGVVEHGTIEAARLALLVFGGHRVSLVGANRPQRHTAERRDDANRLTPR